MVSVYKPDLSHLCIFNLTCRSICNLTSDKGILLITPAHECMLDIANRVLRAYSWMRKTNLLLRRIQAEVSECLDDAQPKKLNSVPEILLLEISTLAHCFEKSERLLHDVPRDNYPAISGHAAWYTEDAHVAVYVLEVKTTRFSMGAWILTRVLSIFQICDETACTSSARFMAYGPASCNLAISTHC